MKTIKYKTLKGLSLQHNNNITLKMIAENMAYFAGRGWCKIELSEEAKQDFYKGIAKVIWKKPTEKQIQNLAYCGGFWFADRLRLDFGKNNNPRFNYCAGQEYNGEIRSIQHKINNI